MAFKRTWFGGKRVVCDGCGASSPLWKAVDWQIRSDRKIFHPNCPNRGSGGFRPLAVLGG